MRACFYGLAVVALMISPVSSPAEEWESLFNGSNLAGWTPINNSMDHWKVEDGTFHCTEGHGWIATNDEYANFELELEFKLEKGANSGVFLRAPIYGDASSTGMEVQILDEQDPKYATIQPYQRCGGLYRCQGPSTNAFKKAGEWQKYHIVVNGRNVKVSLNDTPIVDADLDKYLDNIKEHPGLKNTKGYIGLQSHGGRVDFRNVRVKTLP